MYISDYNNKNFAEIVDDINNLIKSKNIEIVVLDVDYFKFIIFFFIEKIKGYKETDMLGGVDPYSVSKAVSELIIRAYRESFFTNKKNCVISIA